jgi:MFS family permease
MITGNTMLQLTSRPEARGRVMALYGIVFLGSTPIGAPIAGVIGEHLGARVGFILSGAVAAGLGLALLAIGRTRSDRLDVREGDGAEPFAAPAIPAR